MGSSIQKIFNKVYYSEVCTSKMFLYYSSILTVLDLLSCCISKNEVCYKASITTGISVVKFFKLPFIFFLFC